MPTQKEISAHLDLSQQEVSAFLNELQIDWRNEEMSAIRVAYIRKLRAVAAGHKSSSGADLVHERVENERLDRQLKELTLAEKKGQLVNVQQLEPLLAQMVTAFRAELMSRDDRLKDALDALHGIDLDLQVLNDHTHECLEQLARYDPERAGAGASRRGAGEAVASDDDHGLGSPVSAHESEGHGQAGPLQPGPDALGAADSQGA